MRRLRTWQGLLAGQSVIEIFTGLTLSRGQALPYPEVNILTSADLYYNPYLQSASLYVAGKPRITGRLGAFIDCKPMNEWLEPYSRGYRRWEGFLPELVADLNEDSIDIKFTGLPEDYETFHAALLSQNIRVQRLGYKPSSWSSSNIPAFLPEKIAPLLLQLTASLMPGAPSQEALMYMEMITEAGKPSTTDDVRMTYSRLSQAIDKAEVYCRDEKPGQVHKWEKANADLNSIMKKGGLLNA